MLRSKNEAQNISFCPHIVIFLYCQQERLPTKSTGSDSVEPQMEIFIASFKTYQKFYKVYKIRKKHSNGNRAILYYLLLLFVYIHTNYQKFGVPQYNNNGN